MINMTKQQCPGNLILLLVFAVLFNTSLSSQIIQDEAPRDRYYMRKARVTNFWEMKDFRDVFYVDKYLLGRQRISGNISYNFQRVLLGESPKLDYEYRSALSIFTRIRLYEEISFNTTFYVDFNKRAAARWISDYAYSLGRYNWRPFKLNFGYENYQNNKYTDNLDQWAEKAMEGYLFLSYGLALPDKLFRYVKIDSTSAFRVTPFVRFAARYRDEVEKVHYEGKPTAGVSARLTLFWNIYVEAATYYYFTDIGYRQLPWDPDYSYGFGYFDYRAFRLSLTYGNWAVNRFPGKKNYFQHYGFLDGNFRLVLNWQW
jgi:hypothetical protein